MKQLILCFVLGLGLLPGLISSVSAGELENQLFNAINNLKVEGVRILINRGADVNARNSVGESAYQYANGNAFIVCAGGMDMDSPDCKTIETILKMLYSAGAR